MWISIKEKTPFLGIEIDVWAKQWDPVNDTFRFRRFTDCRYFATGITGIPDGWFATHWAPIPEPPK